MQPSQPSLSYLRTIIDNISDIIILIGVNPQESYTILFVNDAFTKSAGFQDVLGKEVADVVGEKSFKWLHLQYIKVKKSKDAISIKRWAQVPAGRRHYEIKLLPVLNAVGDCTQIIAISRDITMSTPAVG